MSDQKIVHINDEESEAIIIKDNGIMFRTKYENGKRGSEHWMQWSALMEWFKDMNELKKLTKAAGRKAADIDGERL